MRGRLLLFERRKRKMETSERERERERERRSDDFSSTWKMTLDRKNKQTNKQTRRRKKKTTSKSEAHRSRRWALLSWYLKKKISQVGLCFICFVLAFDETLK